MWYPYSIETINLLSHEHTNYVFKRGVLTLVMGLNLDRKNVLSDDKRSNGSGKSTILESIMLALDGDIYRDINKNEYIRKGEKSCRSIFIIKNDVLNCELKIDRTIFRGSKSSILELTCSDPNIDKLCKSATEVSISEANKLIFNLIGISKEDFMNYFLLGQGNDHSFFTSTDAKQKDIINRFSNIDLLDKLVETEEDSLKELNSKFDDNKSDLLKAIAVRDNIKEQISDIEYELSESDNGDKDFQDKIDNSNQIIKVANDKIAALNKELKDVEETVEGVNTDDIELKISQIAKSIKQHKSSLNSLELEESKLSSRLKKLNIQESGKIICPKCKTEFIPDDLEEMDLNKIHVEQSEIGYKLSEIQNNINQVNEEIKNCRQESKEYEDILDQFQVIYRNIKSKKYSIKTQKEIIESQKDIIQRLNENIKISRESNPLNIQLNQLSTKLKTQNKSIKLLESESKKIFNDISFKKESLKHLSRSGFKTYLANQAIQSIQDMTNFQLSKFGYNLQVKVNGFKVLANGDLRDKIDIIVYEDGISGGTFKKYSGGEKSVIDVAGMLTVGMLINNSCEYGKGFDGLFLDEKIINLDPSGQYEAVNLLSKTGITTMAVLHHLNINDFPHINNITAVKKNKITTLNENFKP